MNFSFEELAMIAIILDEEEAEEPKPKRRKRHWIHDICMSRKIEGEFCTIYKHLEDDEERFHEYFRMSQRSFNELLRNIEPSIRKQGTFWREAISPRERLAVCLRYLVTGDSLRSIAFNYRMGYSTVYNIVVKTCKIIIEKLMPNAMSRPSQEKWKDIAADFWNIWKFPNCLGVLDGKHVIIKPRPNSQDELFSHKKLFSVVLLAVVDANNKFIFVDIQGKQKEGRTFSHSTIAKDFDSNTMNVPQEQYLPNTRIKAPFVIVADETFALKHYLLRPYPERTDDDTKKTFNDRLGQIRNIFDNTFRMLTQRFQIYQTGIHLKRENVNFVILATCVLHNFIQDLGQNVPQKDDRPNTRTFRKIGRQGGNATHRALVVREKFKEYFNSTAAAAFLNCEQPK